MPRKSKPGSTYPANWREIATAVKAAACGRRIEDLTMQAQGTYERLVARRWGFRGNPVGYGVGYTRDDLERAILAAYRRYWRRKRLWLTQ